MIGRVGDKYRAECDICGEIVETYARREWNGLYIGSTQAFRTACPIKKRQYPEGERLSYKNGKTGETGTICREPNVVCVCPNCAVKRIKGTKEKLETYDFTIHDIDERTQSPISYKKRMTIYEVKHTIGLYYGEQWRCKFALTDRYVEWLNELNATVEDIYFLYKSGRVPLNDRKTREGLQYHLKDMCKGYRLTILRTDYIRTDGGDTRKGFDTIVCEVTTGINDKENLKAFVKENAKSIASKVLNRVKEQKGFQKYGIPINFVKAARITVTNDCLAVCYFSLKEIKA